MNKLSFQFTLAPFFTIIFVEGIDCPLLILPFVQFSSAGPFLLIGNFQYS